MMLHVLTLIVLFAFSNAELKKTDSGTLVVGGKEAPIGKYKFTSNLRYSKTGSSGCGGTLVAPRYIITAAHCNRGWIKYAAVGSHYSSGDFDGEIIPVVKVTSHPNYFGGNNTNDIAIVELEKDSTMPVADLADALVTDSARTGEIATLIGWGKTSHPGSGSFVLKELDVQVVNRTTCQETTGDYYGNPITSSHICAGGINGQAACHGDSGGPLVIQQKGKTPVLIGVVSYGVPCARGYVDVYARISSLRSFIDKHVTGQKWL